VALAGAIAELLEDPERARRLAAAGHRLAVERFSNPARARTMESLYRRLLAGEPAAS
jgi:glycosyltransferase involved in cell wall biosynthesis